MNRYLLLFTVLGMLWLSKSFGQTYPGYSTGNYTGVNGVFFNPANIADNRFKWNINILATNGFIGTDQGGLKFGDIYKTFNSDSLKSKLLKGNSRVNSLDYVDVLGPSFMVSLGPRTSIAFTTRSRVFANARDLNGDLANAMIDATKSGITTPIPINDGFTRAHATGWTELGGSIAQVFSPKISHHFFKGGITLKYIAGTADSYLSTNDLTGTLESIGGIANITGPAGGSVYINSTDANFKNYKVEDFFKLNGHGFGGDIGFVYEYRPMLDYTKYTNDRWANKYKFKIGLSLLDLGSIHFDKSSNVAANYRVDIPAGDHFSLTSFKNKSINEYVPIFNASPYFVAGTPQSSSYSVNLPTTVQMNLDYLFGAHFGVNLAGQFNLNNQKNFNLYYFNSYSITPRWENSMISVELPLNYNELTNINAGLAFRIGPFFIGSGSLISSIFKNTKQADLHVGLNWGIPFRKRLRPDSDHDGVYDDEDACPTIPGVARYHGCPIPDTDGDGVNDEEDACISVPGFARYKGCPIPDRDQDGVNDEEDSCVDVPGLPQFHGCPDADGDGIPDSQDKCPTVYGTAKYNGCPIPDSDGDGVNDLIDRCPNIPGPASSNGCPVEQIAILITADFKNILFNNGKSTIRSESQKIIIHAADIMNEEIPNARFYIDGYTDNVGKASANLQLSKARAQAVVNALINFGVKKDRLISRGFGAENPKCSNATEDGRKCNRRVEVKIR